MRQKKPKDIKTSYEDLPILNLISLPSARLNPNTRLMYGISVHVKKYTHVMI